MKKPEECTLWQHWESQAKQSREKAELTRKAERIYLPALGCFGPNSSSLSYFSLEPLKKFKVKATDSNACWKYQPTETMRNADSCCSLMTIKLWKQDGSVVKSTFLESLRSQVLSPVLSAFTECVHSASTNLEPPPPQQSVYSCTLARFLQAQLTMQELQPYVTHSKHTQQSLWEL